MSERKRKKKMKKRKYKEKCQKGKGKRKRKRRKEARRIYTICTYFTLFPTRFLSFINLLLIHPNGFHS